LARLADGRIFHLELQSQSDPLMDRRMLEYYLLIWQAHGVEVCQLVLYVGDGKPRFPTQIRHKTPQFGYELRDIREIDCQPLLQSAALSDKLLAIFCHLDNERGVVRQVLQQISQLQGKAREDALTMLATVADLRHLSEIMQQEKEDMSLQFSIENNLFMRQAFEQGIEKGRKEGVEKGFEQGIEKGIEKGVEKGVEKGREEGRQEELCYLLQLRFGKKLPVRLRQRIMAANRGQLNALGSLLFEASSMQEFSKRSVEL
jgi:predicted transposase YdaD